MGRKKMSLRRAVAILRLVAADDLSLRAGNRRAE